MKTIWHNPRCSKSRTALNLLKDTSVDVHVFHYLNESFTYEDLMSLIEKLSIPVIELVRTNEKIFRASGLSRTSKDELLIEAMLQNPILIERPIIISGDKAVIGRPITALSPDIIIGRSIKIGFCNIASISNSSLLVRLNPEARNIFSFVRTSSITGIDNFSIRDIRSS